MLILFYITFLLNITYWCRSTDPVLHGEAHQQLRVTTLALRLHTQQFVPCMLNLELWTKYILYDIHYTVMTVLKDGLNIKYNKYLFIDGNINFKSPLNENIVRKLSSLSFLYVLKVCEVCQTLNILRLEVKQTSSSFLLSQPIQPIFTSWSITGCII